MSAYKKIETEYKNYESLIKALVDMGYMPEVGEDPHSNDFTLHGYLQDERPERGAIRISKNQIGAVSNDVGFFWNGSSYDALISDFDNSYGFSKTKQGLLKQRYTLHEAKRLASLQGYSLAETTLDDGTIQLTCSSY